MNAGSSHQNRLSGPGSAGCLVAIALTALLHAAPASAAGGFESTDRPSEHGPALPGFSPRQPPEGFILPKVPDNPSMPEVGQRRLFVRRIAVEGNTVLPDEAIGALVHSLEGREVSVADLEELRQQLTRLYLDAGYINSGAVIPADPLRDGVLSIKMVEGRLDEVRVRGQERLREGYIGNRLQGDPERPLNLKELEDRFQLLLSDPLVSRMNGRILPGASPGHGILDVDVTRARPYHLSVFGDNFRPPSIGAEAFGLTGSLANLTGLGDMLDFTFIHSAGSDRYAGGFNLPLSDSGLLAFFRFDEGDSEVIEQAFRDLHVKSQVHNLEGGFSHPIINAFHQRLNLGVLLAVRQNETTVGGQPFPFVTDDPNGRTQATVWRIYQDYLQRWERHALAARSTFSLGLDALSATPSRSHLPGSDFFAWLGQFQYAYRVDDAGTQFVLRGNAQFANSALLPLERIAVGGVSTVRGYRTNSLVRDNGYTLSAELHYPLLDFTLWDSRSQFDLIPFMDYGEAWDHDESSDALWSVGAGFNWRIPPVIADMFYGYAINPPQAKQSGDLQDDGVYFQVRLDVL